MDRRTFLAGASILMARAAFPAVLAQFATRGFAATEPSLVSATELQTLKALVDVILPATDSPAASAADTHLFVDAAARACATAEEQATLLAGLRELEKQARTLHRRAFAQLSPTQQAQLLKPRAEADARLPYARSFFKILKDYTLVGYFHSEIGATQALAYEQVPGGYEADLPLKPGQKAWAL